ncbi:L-ascorbate metabolism protein UlaG (beta-lactamase superfamily) [Anaerosolibacter carboniphilus]|uniref:L-ascorbate metabolism protein UlaG (Beta-lactamase superfamily) n=1 Tax=Anaerosolibacter carboniphilus TaxID=1417629 RepID=A0A841KP86_9FIRM|nr:MBL fold metallo-hydrolase [Anaerosolibacter carboniphilus]MBB6215276.1 L-ascorbate metabolism protein UlaG (beta-lactamase superfamily) [Anaerosolibacter carboniphilus]
MSKMKFVKAEESVKIGEEAFKEIDNTSIAWLASAGFLINARGTILLIDPVLMTRPGQNDISEAGLKMSISYPIKATDIPIADAVLYTHPDNDHLGHHTAHILAQLNPRFIGPHTVFNRLAQIGINPKNIETCRTGDIIHIKNVTIEVTPADHPWQLQDPQRCGKPFRSGDCCGFIVTTPDVRCFFPGDTRLMEEHLTISDIDLLALDVSIDPFHLNHLGAVVLADSMPNALLIPIHYGTYDVPDKPAHLGNPDDVLRKVKNGSKRARILAPGEMLTLKNGIEI